MRLRRLLILLVAGSTVAVMPALAADQTVTATSSNEFTPANVTVGQGEKVTWTNAGGDHNVKFDDGSFEQPADPSSSNWTVSRTFNTAGTFRYYCEAHGGPGGAGMSGTVTVQTPPPSPPPPGPPPPEPPSVEPSNDFSFGQVTKNKRTGTAKLTVNVPGTGELNLAKTKKLKADEEAVEAAGNEKLAIKPKGKAKKRLNTKGKAKVKVEVTFAPDGGTPNTEDKKIKLVKR
jgi:plastocyanin